MTARGLGVCAGALACVWLAGCGSGASQPELLDVSPDAIVVYTAKLDAIDTTVAIVLRGSTVNAYACGGDSTFATHSRWFCGEAFDGPNGLDTQRFFDGWVLEGVYYDDAFEGRLGRARDDQTVEYFPFTAGRAGPDSRTGAYIADAVNGGCTGAIVVDDGFDAEPQVVGTWCDGAGQFGQVTPVRPVDWASEQMTVSVDHPDVGAPFELRRVFE